MKSKSTILILILATVAIAAALGWIFLQSQRRIAGVNSSASPAPTVAIQDGKTIDFSSGKPVVKNSAEEKAIIDAAVKEMDAATKDVTFSPTAQPPAETKKAESTGTPPKP